MVPPRSHREPRALVPAASDANTRPHPTAGFTFLHVQCLTAVFGAIVLAIRALWHPVGSPIVLLLFPLALTVGPAFAWLAGLGVFVWDKKHCGFVELDPIQNRITYHLMPWLDIAFSGFLVFTIVRIP